jgi:SsrA-binding protein
MAGSHKAGAKIATHRKAFRDYQVIDRLEAGVELRGTEVKSIREGQIDLAGGFARIEGGTAMLCGVTIAPYQYGHQFNHEPTRPRRLLLHRRQIDRLYGQTTQKGFTLIPLTCYFKGRRVKIEIGLCRGRQDPDKREELRRQEAERDARRAIARHK